MSSNNELQFKLYTETILTFAASVLAVCKSHIQIKFVISLLYLNIINILQYLSFQFWADKKFAIKKAMLESSGGANLSPVDTKIYDICFVRKDESSKSSKYLSIETYRII